MPNNNFGEKRAPVFTHENGPKAAGKAWISTALIGAGLLIIGLVLTAAAGPSIVGMVLVPTGVACFLVAAIIKPLEAIHAELKKLNEKS